MTDSPADQSTGKKQLLKIINQTLKEYFDVKRDRSALKLEFDKKQLKLENKKSKLTAKHQEQDGPLEARQAELAATLRELTVPNKLLLMSGKLRSFATSFGTVSLRKKAETTKIADVAGFKRTAKWDGTLTTLGSFTRTWKPSPIKDILVWINANPKRGKKYQRFLETNGGYDELLVKPNDPYLKEYDPDRLTVESDNLGRADDESKDD